MVIALALSNIIAAQSVVAMEDYDIRNSLFDNRTITEGFSNRQNFYGNISNSGDLTINNATFTNNYGEYTANIYNVGSSLNINNSIFNGNTANSYGGSIYTTRNFNINGSVFSNNSTNGDGGAIQANIQPFYGVSTISNSKFINNKAIGYSDADSGAINISNGIYEITSTEFTGNQAKYGGAIYSYSGRTSGVKVTIANSLFDSNSALSGGAIISMSSQIKLATGGMSIIDTIFKNNSATNANGDGGGAMFLGADSVTAIDGSTFSGNTSASYGGAISTRTQQAGNNANAKLDITNTVFENNIASTTGGAIDNHFFNSVNQSGYAYIGNSTFNSNLAANGGAIYNHEKDIASNPVKIYIENSVFDGNKANLGAGGAIYTIGDAIVKNSTFNNNESNGTAYKKQGVGGAIAVNGGNTQISSSTFTNNRAVAGDDNQWSLGGAVSTMNTKSSNVTVEDSTFTGNSAGVGGAIYNMLLGSRNNIEIKGSTLSNNVATYAGGAIANYSDMKISTTRFSGNSTQIADDGGGAMFIGAEATTSITESLFENNTSADRGGAISTRTTSGHNNSTAILDIIDSVFDGNVAATTGGAIDNHFYNSTTNSGYVTIQDTEFTNNRANLGGAIYNHGELDNTGKTASLILSNTYFENNTDSTGNNDIRNDGNLVLADANTFRGGINGTGTLTLRTDSSTILENSASIIQKTINLEADSFINAMDGTTNTFLNAENITLNGKTYLQMEWGDKISASNVNGSGYFVVNDLYINSDIVQDALKTEVFSDTLMPIDTTGLKIFANGKAYSVYQDGKNIELVNIGASGKGLFDAVEDTANSTIFQVGNNYQKDNETTLGTLKDGDLSIKGDRDKVSVITGAKSNSSQPNTEGMKIESGHMLSISDIQEIKDFQKTDSSSNGQGGFIDSEGTVNIIGNSTDDRIILKNMVASKFGGAAANKSANTINTHNSGFVNNSTSLGGGAIANIANSSSVSGYDEPVGANSDAVGNDSFGIFQNNHATGDNVSSTDYFGLGGAIYNFAGNSFNATYTLENSSFIGNVAGSPNDDGTTKYVGKGGAIYNYQDNSGSNAVLKMDDNTFANNIAYGLSSVANSGDGGAIWNNGQIWDLTGAEAPSNLIFTNNTAKDGLGGAIFNGETGTIGDSTNIVIKNLLFNGNNAKDGSAIYNANTNAEINLVDTNLINNKSTNEGGAIVTLGDSVSLAAENNDVVISGNTTNAGNNAITFVNSTGNDKEIHLNANDGKVLYLNDSIKSDTSTNLTVAINDGSNSIGTVILGNNYTSTDMSNVGRATDYVVNAGTLQILNESNFSGEGTNSLQLANGTTLNTINGVGGSLELSQLILDGTSSNVNWAMDVTNSGADSINASTIVNGGNINIVSINTSNLTSSQNRYDLTAGGDNTNLTFSLDTTLQGKVFQDKIFRRTAEIEGNYLTLAPAFGHGSYKSYNPSVLVGPVAAQLGSYLTQLNIYDQAFSNMDMLMLMPREQRQAMKYANKYASTDRIFTLSPNQIPEESRGLWFRPYTSFEKVNLHGGPNVGNTTYGSLFGGDSDLIELKHGWDMTYSFYAGYTGSHQTYDGMGIYQNGGTLGASAVWYKDNFFTGLTANVGANNAEASTMFGSENLTMLATGVASKTGYNWELAKGKFIIQPNFLISYTFVNTFDYTNAAGVRINSDPLNAIQLAPGIKFIGNLKNGWQPYANIQMIWNLIDKAKFTANEVALPTMSVDPYVQYGLGVQKRCGDRFTGFGQAMIRNGGRNGIALSFGFRWALGKGGTSSIGSAKTPIKQAAQMNLNNIK